MVLEVIEAFRPRLDASAVERDDAPAEAAPEVDLALGVDVPALHPPGAVGQRLAVAVADADADAVRRAEVGRQGVGGVEGRAALAASVAACDAAAPHLGLPVGAEFVLPPLARVGERGAAEVSAAVEFL